MGAIKAGGWRSGPRASLIRPFVAIQVAFGLVVLFVGGLLVLSFAKLSTVNPGFAASNILLFSIETVRPIEALQQRAALLETIDRIRTIPDVEAASSADYNVLGRAWTYNVLIPGTAQESVETTMAPVSAGFFETMEIPIVSGRPFATGDMYAKASGAVVVNEAFASRFFGSVRAVGRTVEGRFDRDNRETRRYEVVGVAANTRHDLRQPATPTLYVILPVSTLGTIHVRVRGNPVAAQARLRQEIQASNPLFRVTASGSQATAVARTLLRERLLALLSVFFAGVGVVLVGVGLYGVLSYSVQQRTKEIGIRVALGARQAGVTRVVMADAGNPALLGGASGLALALYLSRFVKALLFEVTPLDFWSLALPLGILVITALVAAVLPAMRAARVDPMIALRHD